MLDVSSDVIHFIKFKF